MLEVFNNLFMAIAEQMGVTLQNTAYSVNIKERLDFSCAVFDGEGRLVANAPAHAGPSRLDGPLGRDDHPPERRAASGPATSSPSTPPITAAPTFPTSRSARRCSTTPAATILFWVASRGHHADVGGTAPGSMTPRATTVEEEGVLIDNFRLVEARPLPRGGAGRAAHRPPLPGPQRRARTSPTSRRRSPPTRWASASSARWSAHFGLEVVRAYMGHVQDNAAESVRRVIDALHDSEFAGRDRPGRGDPGEDQRRPRQARGDGRLHRHQPGAEDQLQRPRAGDARRGALLLPGHGRGRRSR